MKVRERVCVRERVSVGEKRRETSRSPEGSAKHTHTVSCVSLRSVST